MKLIASSEDEVLLAHVQRLVGGDERLAGELIRAASERAGRRAGAAPPDPVTARRWLLVVIRRLIAERVRDRRMPGVADPVVLATLCALPERHRALLVELHLRGRPAAEVAADLGITDHALRLRSTEALRVFRAHRADRAGTR